MKSLYLKFIASLFVLSLALPAIGQPLEIILPENIPSQRTVQLEEQWRIGGDDDEGVLLGVVANAVLDDAGNIYLLDTQLSQVLVFNPDGEHIGTLSREGEGPGELQRPTGIFLNNPNQIGVSQGFPGKIVLLNLDGTPGGSIKPGSNAEAGGFAYVGEAFKRNGHLVVNHGSGAFDMESGKIRSTTMLSKLDIEGIESSRFAEHIQERDMSKQVYDEKANTSELDTWALGNEHVFTVPYRDRYFINVKNMDGSLARTISRPFQPRQRSSEDKNELISGFQVVINGQKMEVEEHILNFDPALSNMRVGQGGRLYVTNCFQNSNLLPAGEAARFDIISKDGKLVEELILKVEGFNPKQDRLAFLDGIHFLWVRNFKSASEAMNSSLAGADSSSEDYLEEVEPLEIIFCRVAE